MSRRIRLRSAAEADVAECARFLQERSTDVAIRFLDALDTTLTLLSTAPGIGSACQFANPLLSGIRVWPIEGFKDYLIFYRLVRNEIEVVRVVHGARDLNALFGQGKS